MKILLFVTILLGSCNLFAGVECEAPKPDSLNMDISIGNSAIGTDLLVLCESRADIPPGSYNRIIFMLKGDCLNIEMGGDIFFTTCGKE